MDVYCLGETKSGCIGETKSGCLGETKCVQVKIGLCLSVHLSHLPAHLLPEKIESLGLFFSPSFYL